MNPKTVKKALKDAIQAMTDYKWLFSARPGKDNTRNRKFPFQKVIPFILAFRGGTLNHEIMDFFGLDPSAGTSSAFIQRRSTILPEAFESLFHDFSRSVDENKLYRGLRLLAVDGSDLQIAANPKDPDSYYPGVNGQRAYNLLHINAMYDLHQHIYVDALVQKSRKADESAALTAMVDRSAIESALLLADRGYEFKKNHFLHQIPSNFVINSSETIKHGIGQSSCFIRANAIKGTNKGTIAFLPSPKNRQGKSDVCFFIMERALYKLYRASGMSGSAPKRYRTFAR